MKAWFRGVSRRSWLIVLRWTVFGTVLCVAVSLVYNWLTLRHLAPHDFRDAMINAALLPVIIAAPLFLLHSLKLRELAIANHALNDLASLDGLTGCLNRRAFTARVDVMLRSAGAGGLLIVDADHFKAINDRYGHDRGDEALRAIAVAIREAVRRDDIVGRVGGEEFCVYAPGAGPSAVLDIAERLRAGVQAAAFAPSAGTQRVSLSVSVGCAVHGASTTYRQLFSLADEQLYVAKEFGRNRVKLACVPGLAPDLEDIGETVRG